MKTLTIEWKHLDVDGKTCKRCQDTGKNLLLEVDYLNKMLSPLDVKVTFINIFLDIDQINESNSILFNGTPIEDIIAIKVSENACKSCSDLVGESSFCRTLHYAGQDFNDIPRIWIREAAYASLGINLKSKHINKHPSCCEDFIKCCG